MAKKTALSPKISKDSRIGSDRDKRARYVGMAAEFMLAEGVDRATLRNLAKAFGTSNRMLLYYFADKGQLIAEALALLSTQLQVTLEEQLPKNVRLSTVELVMRLKKATSEAKLSSYMQVWLELMSLAARGREPFENVARGICDGYCRWIVTRLKPDCADDAPLVLGLMDGLAPLSLAGLHHSADLAMRRFVALCRRSEK